MSERSRSRLGVRMPRPASAGRAPDRARGRGRGIRPLATSQRARAARREQHPAEPRRRARRRTPEPRGRPASAGTRPHDHAGRVSTGTAAGWAGIVSRPAGGRSRPAASSRRRSRRCRTGAGGCRRRGRSPGSGRPPTSGPASAIDSGMSASETKKSRLEMRPSMWRRHASLQQRAPDDVAVAEAEAARRSTTASITQY